MIFTTASANGGRKFACTNCSAGVQFPKAPAGAVDDVSDGIDDDWQEATSATRRKPRKKRRSGGAPPGFYWREFGKMGLGFLEYGAAAGVMFLIVLLFNKIQQEQINDINAAGMRESQERFDRISRELDDLRSREGYTPFGSGSPSRSHRGGFP
jgi:hypothetical protein